MLPVELIRIPIFALLRPDALASTAAIASIHFHRRGTRMFRAGDACEEMSLLLDGFVRLFRVQPSGAERTVALIRPGGVLAIAGLRAEEAHVNDAEALSDARVVDLPVAALQAIGDRNPEVLANLAGGLLARIAGDCTDAAFDAQANLAQRAQRVLALLMRTDRTAIAAQPEMRQLAVHLSHADLARLLGADRASVTRALQSLEARGLVQRERGHLARVGLSPPSPRRAS